MCETLALKQFILEQEKDELQRKKRKLQLEKYMRDLTALVKATDKRIMELKI